MDNQFFNEIKTIKLKDDLLKTLGGSKDGIVEFSYFDIVKSAGHSCPTVAGAYLCTMYALEYLYKDEIPNRGEILVEFKDDLNSGVTGVISNVITQITGATKNSGFKGLNGNFVRHSLMDFNVNINSQIKFTRVDTNKQVEITYNPSSISVDENMSNLMQKVLSNSASSNEKELFGNLWQDRVKRIFENSNKVINIKDIKWY